MKFISDYTEYIYQNRNFNCIISDEYVMQSPNYFCIRGFQTCEFTVFVRVNASGIK